MAKEKHPGGRPTRYKEEFNEQAYKLCLLGYTDADIADFFKVTETTINNWKIAHPEFFESLKQGKVFADAKVADSLYNRALGYSHTDTKFATWEGKITDSIEYTKHYAPDPTSAIFWLKNRQPKQWRDKQEIQIDDVSEKPMTREEKIKLLKSKNIELDPIG